MVDMGSTDDWLNALGYSYEFRYGHYDYDWDETDVWSKDGRVFALFDSGCSCYSFGESMDADTIEGELVEVQSIPSLSDLGDYDETAESIQEDYRNLFRRLRLQDVEIYEF